METSSSNNPFGVLQELGEKKKEDPNDTYEMIDEEYLDKDM